ncbi:hypothetical protein Tco_0490759 [Tanacetum coccineum]
MINPCIPTGDEDGDAKQFSDGNGDKIEMESGNGDGKYNPRHSPPCCHPYGPNEIYGWSLLALDSIVHFDFSDRRLEQTATFSISINSE